MRRGGRNALRAEEAAVKPLHDSSNQDKNSEFKQNPHKNTKKPQFIKKTESISVYMESKGNSEDHEVNNLNGEIASLSIDGEICEEQENKENEVPEFNSEETEGNNEEEEADEGFDSVMIRLEELQLGLEEPELSEEQLRLNDQLQQDELLAVEAIYGENVFMLDNQKGLRSFQIHIHIAASEEFSVTAKPDSSSGIVVNSENLDDFSYTFRVQYLPPIVLTCLLPRSYPSHLAPYFTISVQWLDSAIISNLCLMLDTIWKEQGGQEVIYPWADWLQSCSLSYLGFDKEIVLGPYSSSGFGDRRAVSGCISVDFAVALISGYNDDKCREDFLKSLHECCICFSEYPGTQFIRLPCQHKFCRKCMVTYSDILANESSMRCPEVKCEGIVPPGLLKELIGDEAFERWESHMIQKNLDSMSDIVYCPRCEAPCAEDGDHHAQCSKCFYSFCTLCWERRHLGTLCMSPELKLQKLKERQSSKDTKADQMMKVRDKINQLLSVGTILRDSMQCPSCRMAITRISGCNHMVCKNCGQEFCYQCGKKLVGYNHFGGGCVAFPRDVIDRWERMNPRPRQDLYRVQRRQFVRSRKQQQCPNCRQPNSKIGNNNHVSCGACNTQFCFLCQTIIKRVSKHFRPSGCKQHTVE